MSVTAPALPQEAGAPAYGPIPADQPLRAVAEHMAGMLPAGYRVEILGGSIVVSPTPSNKHNLTIRRIMLQLEEQLPEDKVTVQVTSVGEPGEDDDYAIPDLVVLPAEAEDDDEWLNAPDVADFVLEVVSKGNSKTDTHVKPGEYAGWGIPIYLLVDPRKGTLVCYSDPHDGAYQAVHRMAFGGTVVLPEPLEGIRIHTDKLRRYS